jgi:MraZ protein
MALFLSTFLNKVDKKGRVSVPSQFRSMLYGDDFSGIVIYESAINNCIEGCSIDRIKKLSELIDDLDPFSKERDAFATTILGGSAQLPFDADGRVILPKHLMDFASITEKAVFIGKGQTFEIWEPNKFEVYFKKTREQARKNPSLIRNINKNKGKNG